MPDRIQDTRLRRFRQYPVYKDSGVAWLDEIPAHWDARRLRFVVETRISKGEVKSLDPVTEISFIPMEAIHEYGGIDLESTKPLLEVVESYTYFRDGDVIVAKITPCFENGKGALASGLCSDIGFGTTELHVLRPSCHIHACFLLYLTFSEHFRRIGAASMYGAGGQKRISDDFIRNFRHPVPSSQEQRAIAAFLDRETAKIDGLVTRKERLIELLQEKRTALITHAVTRGLDPNVPMKDSGVDWLGEIPAHWDVKRLKHVSVVENSGAYGTEPGEGAVNLPVCTTAHLTVNGLFLVDDMPVRGFSKDEADRYVGTPGDIFVVKSSGSNTNIISGKLGLVTNATPRVVFSNFLLRIRPSARTVSPKLLAYLLRSKLTRERIRRMVATTTYPNIDVSEYVGSALAIPSVDEQECIAAFLDRETAKMDVLIAKVKEAIDLLKEFRIALISAAVTGKIDVREAVPR